MSRELRGALVFNAVVRFLIVPAQDEGERAHGIALIRIALAGYSAEGAMGRLAETAARLADAWDETRGAADNGPWWRARHNAERAVAGVCDWRMVALLQRLDNRRDVA